MSKLVCAPLGHPLAGLGGFVAPHTVCPFLQKCGGDVCLAGHAGLQQEKYFSCALARALDSCPEKEVEE